MRTRVQSTTREQQNHSAAQRVSNGRAGRCMSCLAGEHGTTPADNSPEAVLQRRLQGIADKGARAEAQRRETEEAREHAARPENRTGLPNGLKSGIEGLSGLSLDDVKVHYNSAAPARLQALAYTEGTKIHVGPGQERHLGHEAWHVAQQKQGRVRPTVSAAGTRINDDPALEREADVMGARAVQRKGSAANTRVDSLPEFLDHLAGNFSVQRVTELIQQQGPSCWLYVLEAVARSKGMATRYIQMAMKAYPSSREAQARQRDEEASGRAISKRAAALELIVDNMTEMIANLHNWKVGEGGRRAGNQIEERIIRRYARNTLGSENSVDHLEFNDENRADVDGVIDAYVEANRRARTLAAITIGESDDVASLLNTAPAIVDQGQEPEDVHWALSVQNLPSYVSIRKRFKVGAQDRDEGSDVVDFTGRDPAEMEATNHAILLDDYDAGAKRVTYKDPNYGNLKIMITHIQFQNMAGDTRIYLRPFFRAGAAKSRLADVEG